MKSETAERIADIKAEEAAKRASDTQFLTRLNRRIDMEFEYLIEDIKADFNRLKKYRYVQYLFLTRNTSLRFLTWKIKQQASQ